MITTAKIQDSAILVGIHGKGRTRHESEESLSELKELARTAGVSEKDSVMAVIREIRPATYVGQGKLEEIKNLAEKTCASIVIFDIELSPAQNRNIEAILKVRVIDRTSLILDIFSLHAHSREGKLQVELAQYEYLYPRLVGAWTHFSKQRGGGVGLRGPGETQLEVDRRRVRERLSRIKKELKKVTSSRRVHRNKREAVPVPTVTLVGYTNAGKSTLFNAITGLTQLAEDKLFATLDPKVKKIHLPSGQKALLTDTVGFIRNLPHQLVEAFKSTFEEAASSHLLLHVIDVSSTEHQDHVQVVEKVLAEIGLSHIPCIKVYNKMDLLGQRPHFDADGMVSVSAKTGERLDRLLSTVELFLGQPLLPTKLFLPHPYGSVLEQVYQNGQVTLAQMHEEGVTVEANLSSRWREKFKEFITGDTHD